MSFLNKFLYIPVKKNKLDLISFDAFSNILCFYNYPVSTTNIPFDTKLAPLNENLSSYSNATSKLGTGMFI